MIGATMLLAMPTVTAIPYETGCRYEMTTDTTICYFVGQLVIDGGGNCQQGNYAQITGAWIDIVRGDGEHGASIQSACGGGQSPNGATSWHWRYLDIVVSSNGATPAPAYAEVNWMSCAYTNPYDSSPPTDCSGAGTGKYCSTLITVESWQYDAGCPAGTPVVVPTLP
jgi:hypothetical protein